MTITTLSSREFNHDTGRAKRAALKGPVFITDRGRPALVLMSIDAYKALQPQQGSIADLLAMPEAEAVEFEPPRLAGPCLHEADLS
ncbi:MAG: type II toxin-antitoxin system Phd/YefM family antitoxin [Chromatiaceae bacterium]|nr:type II toxin-antitoxin system Phd/YefM family antitoxin [Chromatiaceae bacterium]